MLRNDHRRSGDSMLDYYFLIAKAAQAVAVAYGSRTIYGFLYCFLTIMTMSDGLNEVVDNESRRTNPAVLSQLFFLSVLNVFLLHHDFP